jgi:glutamyl-tRNA synthetase
MIRVRFVAPAAGALLVAGARVALANARFAASHMGGQSGGQSGSHRGHFILRSPGLLAAAGDDRIVADLRWLGIAWDAVGQPGDYAGAIEHLKRAGVLYPCFESDTELRAKREFRIRRGRPAVYDRAMLKLTPEQRVAAEAGGKRPYWRLRLSNRTVAWTDAVLGRREAKLPTVSDPILVAADGTPSTLLAAAVDDCADEITHIVRGDEGDGATGVYIELMETLGRPPGALTFAHLPALGDTGRLAIRNLRHDGIDPEAITTWLGGDEGFSLRRMARKPDAAALPALNREVLRHRDFGSVADRLPPGATEEFWLAIRGHIDLLTEARHWWHVVSGTIFPPVPDRARSLARAASNVLPPEPWDTGTWSAWLAAIPRDAGPDRAATLRLLLTGEEQETELANLLPLIGRSRVLERLRGV